MIPLRTITGRVVLAGSLSLGVLLSAAPSGAQVAVTGEEASGEVTGRVVAEEGGPLGNVLVYLVGTTYADTTAPDGSFRLDGVAPGRYRVAAYHSQLGEDPAVVVPVEVESGTEVTAVLRIRLPPVVAAGCAVGSGSVVRGHVEDASTGTPLPGAEVELWLDRDRASVGGSPGERRRVRVGSDGTDRFCSVPAGRHVLVSELPWTDRFEVEVVVPEARVVGVDLGLSAMGTAPGRIVGRVLDAETGRPIEGVTVEVGGASTVSDEEGRFMVADVEPGTVSIRARVLGYAPAEGSIELQAGATQGVQVRLGTQPIEIEPVTVTARPRGLRTGRLADLYERLESGWGTFVLREELERRNIRKLTWLLQEMGFRVHHNDRFLLNPRQRCAPMVYVDGVRVTYLPAPRASMEAQEEAAQAVNFVNPASVAVMEVYQGAAVLPPVYRGSATRCGVIGIWTQGYDGSPDDADRIGGG